MANKKNKNRQITITTKGMEAREEALKPLEFTAATVNDYLCDYTYRIKIGIGQGNSHNVQGNSVIHDDLKHAIEKLDKHMAYIDMVFNDSGTDFDDINQVENNEFTARYTVSGFSLSGGEDNLSVILSGVKQVTLGRIKFKTPKIELTENSSYHWHEDLKHCIDVLKKEVQLYHEGKCTVKEEIIDSAQIALEIEANFEDAKQ